MAVTGVNPIDASSGYLRATVTDAEIRWLISGEQADPFAWLAQLTRRPWWHSEAACRRHGPSAFIIGRGANAATMDRAKAVCSGCPVSEPCLAFALADPDAVGIWAGTTAQERRQLRRDAAMAPTGAEAIVG